MSLLCLVLLGAGTSMLLSTAAPIDAIVPETNSAGASHRFGPDQFVRTWSPPTTPILTSAEPASASTTDAPAAAPEPAAQNVKVDFQHYINETPPPASDVPVAPGANQLSFGIDRYDGLPGGQNIFQWTFDRYLASRSRFDDPTATVATIYDTIHGHEAEVMVGGVSHMVPDQLTIQPQGKCESAAQSNTKIVKSSEDMAKEDSSSQSTGISAGTSVGPVPATAGMQYGSSQESQEYENAKSNSKDVSVFSSVTATAWKTQLNGFDGATASPMQATDLSDGFKGAVNMLGDTPSNDQLREFVLTFGTDFLTNAILGGKITQQTTMTKTEEESAGGASVKEASSKAFSASVGPVEASTTSSESSGTSNSQSSQTATTGEVQTAKFQGGVPNEDFYEWCASVKERPFAISYSTVPISKLIREQLKNAVVADQLETFVTVTRKAEMNACDPAGQHPQVYDKVQGKCIKAECGEGTYGVKPDGEDNEQCYDCPAGKSGKGGVNSCMDCAIGKYSAAKASSCATCEAGRTSDASSSACEFLSSGKYQLKFVEEGSTTARYLTETDKGTIGDKKDLNEDTERWSYWSDKSDKMVWLTHASSSLYRISNTAESRKLAVEDGGDKDKGGAGYWGKFTPKTSSDFTITCKDWPATTDCQMFYGSYAAIQSGAGDSNVPSGGKWLAFKSGSWKGKLSIIKSTA